MALNTAKFSRTFNRTTAPKSLAGTRRDRKTDWRDVARKVRRHFAVEHEGAAAASGNLIVFMHHLKCPAKFETAK